MQRQRTASQPRQLSAGSVFANPEGDFAGRLIEAAGLKGVRRGGAQISTQHANFIVNVGSRTTKKATAREVFNLMRFAQEEVQRQFGRWLEPEIELVGRWSSADRAALRRPTNHEVALP
jgi:UDP-N-acetylmuramate dehydrogenase